MSSDQAPPGFRLTVPGLVAIAFVQAVWFGWFLLDPLPSTGAQQIRRFDLVMRLLPAVVPGVRWADSYLGLACGNLSHFANLPQRIPILLASLTIAAAAIAVGAVVLRGLGAWTWLTRAEQVALGFGLGTVALGVGTLGLGRTIGLNPTAVRSVLGALILGGAAVEGLARRRGRGDAGEGLSAVPGWSTASILGLLALVGPFLLLMGLGAMLPTIEFDALEYHLQGPKEYFLDGRVGFLPHNVYTSMPFGVEMLTTLAMETLDDWWLGGLAGQELIAWFAPASAILIGSAAATLGRSSRAGWFASLVYLTTPWIFRVAGTPFVEGPLCFFHAALIWSVVRLGWFRGGPATVIRPGLAAGTLVGLLAGGAMAIKYPALVSAVVPAALVVLVAGRRARSPRLLIGFCLGLGLVVAPWLGKNVVDTGNPVYPLAWSVVGGGEWDAARDAQWRAAHGPRPIAAGLLVGSLLDVAGRSDWQSPLYVALVPLAWLAARCRAAATALAGYALYLFATWWLLTHRLDRFWLPMLPPLAILAGLGGASCGATGRAASVWLTLIVALTLGSNLTLCSTELSGATAWTGDLATVRLESARDGTPSLARLDEALPAGARPLVIGQAGTFGLRHRPFYNTVFNRDRFESLARGRPPAEVHKALLDQGITHVYVDWAEIDRYRRPGNYGFTAFETPDVFAALVDAGVLDPASRIGAAQVLYKIRPSGR